MGKQAFALDLFAMVAKVLELAQLDLVGQAFEMDVFKLVDQRFALDQINVVSKVCRMDLHIVLGQASAMDFFEMDQKQETTTSTSTFDACCTKAIPSSTSTINRAAN
jgi:hypothetical protein